MTRPRLDESRVVEVAGRLTVAHVMDCEPCEGRGEIEACVHEMAGEQCWAVCRSWKWRECPDCNGRCEKYDLNCTCDECHALRAPLDAANKVAMPEVLP